MLVCGRGTETGVTSVGVFAKTLAPLPVSSVNAVARFAEDGVARKVATPVPSPLMPVETGSPVAFVSVTLVGVPRIGVAGTFERTGAAEVRSKVCSCAKEAPLTVTIQVPRPG
jgi:hypothetical protein